MDHAIEELKTSTDISPTILDLYVGPFTDTTRKFCIDVTRALKLKNPVSGAMDSTMTTQISFSLAKSMSKSRRDSKLTLTKANNAMRAVTLITAPAFPWNQAPESQLKVKNAVRRFHEVMTRLYMR